MEKIYVLTSEEKRFFLHRGTNEKCDYLTLPSFLSGLIGEYDERALLYIKSLGYSFSNAEKILSLCKYLFTPTSPSLLYLKEIKDELVKRGYVYHNPYYLIYLKTRQLYLSKNVAYDGLTSYLKQHDISFEVIELQEHIRSRKIANFDTLQNEVRGLFTLIYEEYKNGTNFKNIKVMLPNQECENVLRQENNYYNLPFAFDNKVELSFQKNVCQFLKHLESMSIEDAFEEMGEDIASLPIDSYIALKNDYSEEQIKEYFLYYFTREISHQEGSIEIVSSSYIPLDNEVLFVLSFNASLYPLLHSLDSYPSEEEKKELGLITNQEKNQFVNNTFFEIYHSPAKVIFLSHKMHGKKEYYPSIYLDQYNFEEIRVEPLLFTRRSYEHLLAIYEDGKLLYGKINPYSWLIDKENLPYMEYDSSFKVSTPIALDKTLRLSYSSLSKYIKCPFNYYLSKVLRLDEFEESLASKIGNMFHKVMEIRTERNQEIDQEAIIKEFTLDAKEEFYLRKLFPQSIVASNRHIDFVNQSLFDTEYKEAEEFSYVIADNAFLIGRIDDVLLDSKNKYISVIDFKTNDESFKKAYVEYGSSLQLPVYLLLLEDKFKDYQVIGTYIMKVLSAVYEYEGNEKEFKLKGITLNDLKIIDSLDPEGEYINGLALTKSGTLRANAPVVSDEDIKKYKSLVLKQLKEVSSAIKDSKFEIAPKKIGKEQVPCTFCSFHDICFLKPQNIKYINITSEQEEEK